MAILPSRKHEVYPDVVQSICWYVRQEITRKQYINRKGFFKHPLLQQELGLVVTPQRRKVEVLNETI